MLEATNRHVPGSVVATMAVMLVSVASTTSKSGELPQPEIFL